MAMKVAKKLEELKRTKAKIKELQNKQTLLEESIKREEDEEIVRTLRSLKPGHEELVEIIEGIRSGRIGLDDLRSKAQDSGSGVQEEYPVNGISDMKNHSAEQGNGGSKGDFKGYEGSKGENKDYRKNNVSDGMRNAGK